MSDLRKELKSTQTVLRETREELRLRPSRAQFRGVIALVAVLLLCVLALWRESNASGDASRQAERVGMEVSEGFRVLDCRSELRINLIDRPVDALRRAEGELNVAVEIRDNMIAEALEAIAAGDDEQLREIVANGPQVRAEVDAKVESVQQHLREARSSLESHSEIVSQDIEDLLANC